MSGTLRETPAKIIRQLLIDEGVVVDATGTADWTSYVQNEPDLPANSVTIYTTSGRRNGRLMPTGQTQVHYGIQTRIRAESRNAGFLKATEIYDTYDGVLRFPVTLDSSLYIVQAITNVGHIIPLGNDRNTTRRLYTINSIVDLYLDSEQFGDFFSSDFEDDDFGP